MFFVWVYEFRAVCYYLIHFSSSYTGMDPDVVAQRQKCLAHTDTATHSILRSLRQTAAILRS